MSHDILAELDGYRNELANAQRYGQDEQVAAVQEQIDRVKAAVEARAVEQETRAASFKADGQDVVAAQHDVEARRYRDALVEPGAEPETAVTEEAQETAIESGSPETAVDSAPTETATPARKSTRGGK